MRIGQPGYFGWQAYIVLSGIVNSILAGVGLYISFLMAQAAYIASSLTTRIPFGAKLVSFVYTLICILAQAVGVIMVLAYDSGRLNAIRHLSLLSAWVFGVLFMEISFYSVYRSLISVGLHSTGSKSSLHTRAKSSQGDHNKKDSDATNNHSKNPSTQSTNFAHIKSDSLKPTSPLTVVPSPLEQKTSEDKREIGSWKHGSGMGRGSTRRKSARSLAAIRRRLEKEKARIRIVRKLTIFLILVPTLGALVMFILFIAFYFALISEDKFSEETNHEARNYNVWSDIAFYLSQITFFYYQHYAHNHGFDVSCINLCKKICPPKPEANVEEEDTNLELVQNEGKDEDKSKSRSRSAGGRHKRPAIVV
uniref:Uncharacterized protein n=1 Tax=Amorphochlora amoebiformis TaxID=1561963 RepID=A0A7S0DRR0_9EUKA|mmetsp:Transcript_7488/g.11586  ORF Transcript_7488/g.11586 Transcript_7488/m.11586 type:complete len:364 (+) Transcript_7488:220-1311(+)